MPAKARIFLLGRGTRGDGVRQPVSPIGHHREMETHHIGRHRVNRKGALHTDCRDVLILT